MKITALEEYGLRCLLRVAQEEEGEALSAQAIADMEGLSLSYTQKIMRILSQGNLVGSRRGAQGGFYLKRPADEITLGDAIGVLGGVFEVEEICERHTGELEECAHHCNCTIRPVWAFISRFVLETLNAISLADLQAGEFHIRRHLLQSTARSSRDISESII